MDKHHTIPRCTATVVAFLTINCGTHSVQRPSGHPNAGLRNSTGATQNTDASGPNVTASEPGQPTAVTTTEQVQEISQLPTRYDLIATHDGGVLLLVSYDQATTTHNNLPGSVASLSRGHNRFRLQDSERTPGFHTHTGLLTGHGQSTRVFQLRNNSFQAVDLPASTPNSRQATSFYVFDRTDQPLVLVRDNSNRESASETTEENRQTAWIFSSTQGIWNPAQRDFINTIGLGESGNLFLSHNRLQAAVLLCRNRSRGCRMQWLRDSAQLEQLQEQQLATLTSESTARSSSRNSSAPSSRRFSSEYATGDVSMGPGFEEGIATAMNTSGQMAWAQNQCRQLQENLSCPLVIYQSLGRSWRTANAGRLEFQGNGMGDSFPTSVTLGYGENTLYAGFSRRVGADSSNNYDLIVVSSTNLGPFRTLPLLVRHRELLDNEGNRRPGSSPEESAEIYAVGGEPLMVLWRHDVEELSTNETINNDGEQPTINTNHSQPTNHNDSAIRVSRLVRGRWVHSAVPLTSLGSATNVADAVCTRDRCHLLMLDSSEPTGEGNRLLVFQNNTWSSPITLPGRLTSAQPQ